MNTAATTTPLQGQRTPDMSIAWEAQPSLQHLVVRHDAVAPILPRAVAA